MLSDEGPGGDEVAGTKGLKDPVVMEVYFLIVMYCALSHICSKMAIKIKYALSHHYLCVK